VYYEDIILVSKNYEKYRSNLGSIYFRKIGKIQRLKLRKKNGEAI